MVEVEVLIEWAEDASNIAFQLGDRRIVIVIVVKVNKLLTTS